MPRSFQPLVQSTPMRLWRSINNAKTYNCNVSHGVHTEYQVQNHILIYFQGSLAKQNPTKPTAEAQCPLLGKMPEIPYLNMRGLGKNMALLTKIEPIQSIICSKNSIFHNTDKNSKREDHPGDTASVTSNNSTLIDW